MIKQIEFRCESTHTQDVHERDRHKHRHGPKHERKSGPTNRQTHMQEQLPSPWDGCVVPLSEKD